MFLISWYVLFSLDGLRVGERGRKKIMLREDLGVVGSAEILDDD